MAGLGMVDVSHGGSLSLSKPNFRPPCSYGQMFASHDATSYLQQASQSHQLANSKRRQFREEGTGSAEICVSSRIRCRSFGNWHISQRGRIKHDKFTSRGEGLGRGGRSIWPLSGQCCIVSNFSEQFSSSGTSANSRVRGNVTVRCEGESAATYGIENDTATYSEAGEVWGQGGVDGAEGESVSPIALENSPMNNSVDDGYAMIRNNEGDDNKSLVTDDDPAVAISRDSLRIAKEQLEIARGNSTILELKAQQFAERALELHDQATSAGVTADAAVASIQSIVEKEAKAAENVTAAGVKVLAAQEKFTRAEKAFQVARWKLEPPGTSLDDLSLEIPEAYLQQDVESTRDDANGEASLESSEIEPSGGSKIDSSEDDEERPEESSSKGKAVKGIGARKEYQLMESARVNFADSEAALAECEAGLAQIQVRKVELGKEALRRSELSQVAKEAAALADEDVASAMILAEEAVALEVEAAQRASDAEIALRKAEALAEEATKAAVFAAARTEKLANQVAQLSSGTTVTPEPGKDEEEESIISEKPEEEISLVSDQMVDTEPHILFSSPEIFSDTPPDLDKLDKPLERDQHVLNNVDPEQEEIKKLQNKRPESTTKETPGPKSSTKKSSRFYSASYFSSGDEAEFFPSMVFSNLASALKKQLVNITVGTALLIAGGYYFNSRMEKRALLAHPPEVTASIQEFKLSAKPLISEIQKLSTRVKQAVHQVPHQEVNEEEASLFDVLWLLLASVIFVPIFQRLPGGSPVLGYLAAGVLIGPYALSIIKNVHGTRMIAEFGVVFLLFNIGLELSVERLTSMKKYVFGFGSIQVLATALAIGTFAHVACGLSGPTAIVIGNGLALSSTAVVLQVLQERGESTSRHGRATFSVLLFQDLAVVVLLILIPLLSPNSSKGGVGIQAIAEALGIAGIKAAVAITGIIAGGRLLLRPVYKRMAENHNAEIFAANTLLVVLGTSVMTARAGLSMALGAFLAGLLLAETEFALQVESDIAPYRGLLLGLFFMTVGMSIDSQLFVNKFPVIVGALVLLIGGKTLLVMGLGRIFGLSTVVAARAGLLLAPGGEFAFVAFGEAVNQGIMSIQLSSLLFLVVGLSMAITPWLAAGGQLLASRFDQQDVRSLLPAESETDDLQDHILICGFGRVGQIIAQLLSERLIPFVALDVRSERVSVGRALDLPVYFGDAGSKEVLHKVGAERAAAAVLTLDTPGANYRTVWALSKNFPHVKTFVRAHDVEHGLNLERAGATAVVPETLEPSLQLAAAVLSQAKLPAAEIAAAIDEFRTNHLSELRELSETSGTSLGYGFSRIMMKSKNQPAEGQANHRIDGGVNDWRPEGSVLP